MKSTIFEGSRHNVAAALEDLLSCGAKVVTMTATEILIRPDDPSSRWTTMYVIYEESTSRIQVSKSK